MRLRRTIASRCVVEVGGVGEAVAADVGAGRVLWVGPPVVAFGVEVVRVRRRFGRI